MNKNTKRIVITILIIVSIITFFFVSKELKSKKIEKLPEVKLKEINKKNNMFAVMVETEDNNYEEYKEEGWPGEGYIYKEAKCIDNKGSLINENIITFENDTVALETDKTVYCTLYFDVIREITLLADDITISEADATLTNIITNGSYEQGSTGWTNNTNVTIVNTDASHGNNSLKFNAGPTSTAISTQNVSPPELNHKYYGRLMFKSSPTFTTEDDRYEWRYADGYYKTMVYANKNIKAKNWTLLSKITSITQNTYLNQTWIIRNFLKNNTEDAYTDELMIIDLTKAYGNSIPTKDYLDNNLFFFENNADIKTIKAIKGEFNVSVQNGYIECNNGIGTITDGKVTITGNSDNISCVLRKGEPVEKVKKNITLLADSINITQKDATLTNIITNGSYEQGSTGWTNNTNVNIVNTDASHGNNSLKFNAGPTSTAISTQNVSPPELNHQYYGRLMFKSSPTFTTGDNRYEWYYTDVYYGTMVYANKNIKAKNWTLLSKITSIPKNTYLNQTWIIRNFLVNNTEDAYTDELMIIDLTKAYGNSIPTKDYLDNNLFFFENNADIKTIKAIKGEFNVSVQNGYIECTSGGFGTIANGKVTITGNSDNISCIIRKS